jgi:hypothetical protein
MRKLPAISIPYPFARAFRPCRGFGMSDSRVVSDNFLTVFSESRTDRAPWWLCWFWQAADRYTSYVRMCRAYSVE